MFKLKNRSCRGRLSPLLLPTFIFHVCFIRCECEYPEWSQLVTEPALPKVDFLIDALIEQDKTAKGQGQPTAHPASSLKTPETHTYTEPIKLQIDVIVSNASKLLFYGRVFV